MGRDITGMLPNDTAAADFIRRWGNSGAAERANYQLFLSELCDLLGVPRPAYQNANNLPHPAFGHPLPEGEGNHFYGRGQGSLPLHEGEGRGEGGKAKLLWPKTLPEQVQAVRAALASAAAPSTAETIARTFQRARADKVGELLETLAALGQVREVEKGSFVA